MPLHFPLFHDASEAPNTLCPSSIAVKAHCAKGGMAAFQTLSEFILLCSEDMGLGELKAFRLHLGDRLLAVLVRAGAALAHVPRGLAREGRLAARGEVARAGRVPAIAARAAPRGPKGRA